MSPPKLSLPIWVIPELAHFEKRVIKYACESGYRELPNRKRVIWIALSITRLGKRNDMIGEEILVTIQNVYRQLGYRGPLELAISEQIIYESGGWGCHSATNEHVEALKRKLKRQRALEDCSQG